jgi:hypothetical protein
MSATTNVALAGVLAVGHTSPAFADNTHGKAESSHGKSVKRVQVHKPQRQGPPTLSREQNAGGGCFSDDGGGRIRPCDAGGSGGGGGY